MRTVLAILAAIAATGHADAAENRCQIGKLLELPVTMVDRRPTVMATLDGRPLRLTVDSGAFFSSLSPSAAARYGFERHPAPRGLRVIGVGGDVETEVTTIKDFRLGQLALHRVDFLVGGSQGDPAGLLGQNILGIADVEYDLAAGAVRLMRPKNCGSHVNLAYWANGKPVSVEKIDSSDSAQKHTQGIVVLDGVRLKAMFDTGAPTSLLSRRAAARVGVKPGGAGVFEDGDLGGLGRQRIRTWTGSFGSLQIGDNETIKKIRLRFGDLGGMGDIDMLIGADFFLSHRVYVSNALHQMFFTYNGGPVFDLTARSAPASP